MSTPSSPHLPPDPNSGSSEKKGVLKAAGVMGSMTFISRVLGMIRDIVSAAAFGTTWQWDAFLYAFMLPNFFRRIIGEGAFSSAFIPVYSEALHKKGKDTAFRFANVTFTVLVCILTALVLGVEILLNWLISKGAMSGTLLLAADLLRFLFPYLWFISLFALGMGVLNSHRHFLIPSLGPVLLNVVWIIGVLWIVPKFGGSMSDQVRVLACVILFAGMLQLLCEIPPLYQIGFRIRWIWDTACEELAKTGKLFLPAVFGFAVFQINILIDMTLAFLIGPGANSSLWYGTRLMQFPLGVFAIAMGTALLPSISRLTVQKEHKEAQKTLSFALRSIFLIILPCSLGLMVLSEPIVGLLFERGKFDAVSTSRTSAVLWFYAIGLFAYSGQKMIINGFHATQDTKTPVKIAAISLVVNVVFNLILMGPLREAGLALATSIAGIFQFGLLLWVYHRKVLPLPFFEIGRALVKMVLATAVMAAVCYFSFLFLLENFSGISLGNRLIHVFGAIAISVITYFVCCGLFKVHEIKEVMNLVKAKK